MTATEILIEQGHTPAELGRCERCWLRAASMYAMGQGTYESQTEAYYEAMKQAEDSALEQAKEGER